MMMSEILGSSPPSIALFCYPTRVGYELANQIGDLRICTASHECIREMKSCCYGLCSHRLAGSSRATKQEIPHWLTRLSGHLRVFTHAHDLMWDYIPVRQFGYHCLFAGSQLPLLQHVFPSKVIEVYCGCRDNMTGSQLQNAELTVCGASGGITSLIQCQW